jgi:hypothetical protein
MAEAVAAFFASNFDAVGVVLMLQNNGIAAALREAVKCFLACACFCERLMQSLPLFPVVAVAMSAVAVDWAIPNLRI